MLRILLICTGNTCRSPMAEALLNEKIRQNGLSDKVKVLSAGLCAGDGSPASAGAQTVMGARGLTLSVHRSRQLSPESVQAADLVLTMTVAHKKTLTAMIPEARGKVYTLAEYAGEPGAVSDPFGGSIEVYEASATAIEQLLEKAWPKIVVLAGKNC